MHELNATKSMDPCKREADITTEQKVCDAGSRSYKWGWTLRKVSHHQKLEDVRNRLPRWSLQRGLALPTLWFQPRKTCCKFLDYRTIAGRTSVVWSSWVCGNLLQQQQETHTRSKARGREWNTTVQALRTSTWSFLRKRKIGVYHTTHRYHSWVFAWRTLNEYITETLAHQFLPQHYS